MKKTVLTIGVLLSLLFLLSATGATAQSFRIEDWKDLFGKGKPLKLTGGFSANSPRFVQCSFGYSL
jgi:hypothetical protein